MDQNLESHQAKYKALLEENALLDRQIEEFKSKGVTADLQPQIKALHDYNEMKDLTQVVLGYLADVEHVSIAELHVRHNLPLD
ncbi:hypothetical protein MTP99_009989 [Tenebrio molitor]|jgi:hypothetical protein|nr:hypothetical protein MTP99_009989 [Tenebrio molitor]